MERLPYEHPLDDPLELVTDWPRWDDMGNYLTETPEAGDAETTA